MSAPYATYSITAPGFYGLNKQDAPVDMDPKFALEANNCIIDKFGRVGSRKGWVAAHDFSATLGNNYVDAIGELITSAGGRTILCAGNSKLFKLVSGTPNTLSELTYGGGGVAPTITSNNWQMVQLNGTMLFFQGGYDPLIFDPSLSGTQYRRLSEHPLYSGSAPQANCALSAYGRIWAANTTANKNTVYWSDTLSFMKWTGGTSGSLNLHGVWPNGTDEVVALGAHNNFLYIFGRRQILIYSGADNPLEMRLADALTNSGCVARDSLSNAPGDLIYLSDNGVTSIKRTIQEKSQPLSNISRNVNDDVKSYLIGSAGDQYIKAVYSPIDQFYLLTFVQFGVTYCFDMKAALQDGSSRVSVWYGMTPRSYCYCSDSMLRVGMLSYIGNHDGYTDNGATYRMSYYSAWIDFGDPIRTSILKKIIMTLFGAVNQSVVYKWGFDYITGSQAQPEVLTGVSLPAEYGIAEYGIAEYGNNLIVSSLPVNAGGVGQVIQVGLEVQVFGRPISVQRVDIFTKNGAYKA